MCERSVRPDKTSWSMVRKVRPDNEETHHDGTAQSVVNETMLRDRLERSDIDSQEGAWPQQFVIGNYETELELSVESNSFVNRVNDQVRKRQTTISNVTEDGEKHSVMGNVHDCNNGTSSIHWKKLPEQLSIHREHNRSHLEENVRHIYKIGVWARWDLWIGNKWWCKPFMEILWLIGDERVINLQRTKVYVFSDSVLYLGKILENPQSNDAWEQRLGWIKSTQN